MKLNNTRNMKRKSGMTLLELTVVILVLLSLISILFIGARAWKKGSDRAANILNIRNVQQAVRAHVNVRGLTTPPTAAEVTAGATAVAGSSLPSSDIIGGGKYLNTVTAPAGLPAYSYGSLVPAVGTLYVTNNFDDTEYGWGSDTTKYAEW